MVKFIENFLLGVLRYVARTLRRFVFFALAMFVLGMVYGEFVNQVAQKLLMPTIWLTIIPVILAVLSYYITEIAIVVFIALLGLVLIAFL